MTGAESIDPSGEPSRDPNRDRFERPALGWYAVIDGGWLAATVFAVSPRLYTAVASRLPLPPRKVLTAIGLGTLVAHVVQAGLVHRTAKRSGMPRSARRWAIEAFIVGFPSMLKLRSVAAGAARG